MEIPLSVIGRSLEVFEAVNVKVHVDEIDKAGKAEATKVKCSILGQPITISLHHYPACICRPRQFSIKFKSNALLNIYMPLDNLLRYSIFS